MTTDIARLRALAEKATPVSWDLRAIHKDAIAAVLALLTELETTRAQVAEMRTALEQWKCEWCGGSGKRHRAPWNIAIPQETCSFCNGDGLKEIARQALSPTPAEKATPTGRSAE
jgi:hypothetical protein